MQFKTFVVPVTTLDPGEWKSRMEQLENELNDWVANEQVTEIVSQSHSEIFGKLGARQLTLIVAYRP